MKEKNFKLRDYLDSASDAAKRVRAATLILIIITVLLFSAFLNAFLMSWMFSRVDTFAQTKGETSEPYFNVFETNCQENSNCDWRILRFNEPDEEKVDTIEELFSEAKENSFNRWDKWWGNSKNNEINNKSIDVKKEAIIVIETDKDSLPIKYQRANTKIYKIFKDADKEDSIKVCKHSYSKAQVESVSILEKEEKKISIQELCLNTSEFIEIKEESERKESIQFYETFKLELKHIKTLYYGRYNNLHRSLVDNAYTLKVPFFGVAIDINNLGFLGGVSLIIVLLMLRFALRSCLLSLRLGIKKANELNQEEEFYEILATRQLFAFPILKDTNQTIYPRRSERKYLEFIWFLKKHIYPMLSYLKVISFLEKRNIYPTFLNKYRDSSKYSDKKYDNNKPYDSKPHGLLRKLPFILFLFVLVIYLLIFVNDWATHQGGYQLNEQATDIQFGVSLFCLFAIGVLEYWCLSKWREIYIIWNRFYKVVLLKDIYKKTKNIIESDKTNSNEIGVYKEIVEKLESLPLFDSHIVKEKKALNHNINLLDKILNARRNKKVFLQTEEQNKKNSIEKITLNELVNSFKRKDTKLVCKVLKKNTDEVIKGAVIKQVNKSEKIVSDESDNYVINNIDSDRISLRINANGFKSVEVVYDIKIGETNYVKCELAEEKTNND